MKIWYAKNLFLCGNLKHQDKKAKCGDLNWTLIPKTNNNDELIWVKVQYHNIMGIITVAKNVNL